MVEDGAEVEEVTLTFRPCTFGIVAASSVENLMFALAPSRSLPYAKILKNFCFKAVFHGFFQFTGFFGCRANKKSVFPYQTIYKKIFFLFLQTNGICPGLNLRLAENQKQNRAVPDR